MKMKRLHIRYILFLIGFMLVGLSASAQIRVKGVVVDEKKVPLVGVTVQVQNTMVGTTSNGQGEFEIVIPENASKELKVSYIGYESQVVAVGTATNLTIVLKESASEIDEVVVVGYGTMRKSDLTGSVSTVKIDETQASRESSIDQILRGRAAGVQVTSNSFAPGAGVSILIRGTSTLNGGREPLYVVDGVILNPPTDSDGKLLSQGNSNNNSDQSTNGLLGLNPQDIASMEILKDASATAIYGAMGANGVVLITTKMGTSNTPTVNWTSSVDVSTLYKKIPLLDFDGYVEYMDAKNAVSELERIFVDPADRSLGLKVTPVDWQDYVMRTAISHRHRVSISGKTETTNYMVAAGYSDSQGIIKKTGVKVADLRFNLDKNLSRSVKIGTRMSFSQIRLEMTQGSDQTKNDSSTSMIKSMMTSKPYYNFEIEQGTESDPDADPDDLVTSRPSMWLKDFNDHSTEYRVTPNLYLEVKLTDWLTYRGSIGGDYRNKERGKWKGPFINTSQERALAGISNTVSLRYNMDHLLLVNKDLGDHHISGTLGITSSASQRRTPITEGWNIFQYAGQDQGINSAPYTRFGYSRVESSILSYLARGVYNYKERYVLTATFRVDGSSKFEKGNKYSFFPSFAFAWRPMEEKWVHLPAFISNLKFRYGWGRVGNEAVSPYQTKVTYSSNLYPDHTPGNTTEGVVGVSPDRLLTSDLKWETTEQHNLGVDLGFFQNRLTFSLDLYHKNTYDLLQELSTPLTSGYDTAWVNRGEIQNQGLEMVLDAMIVSTKNFQWDFSGNISFNRNKIVDIGLPPLEDGSPNYFLGSNIGSSNYLKQPANIFMQGQPVGMFYGFKTDGIVQEGETGPAIKGGSADEPMQPGGIKYVLRSSNMTGVLTDDDRMIIGNPNPDFTFGFSTTFSYKRLTLSASFNGVYGNDIVNANLMTETDVTRYGNIRREAFYEAWTPERPSNKYPSLTGYSSAETQYFTDRIIEDGSYLRLANLSLSYDIPLKKVKFIKQLSVSLTANNLYVWTKYSGWDPEVNSFGTDMTRMGVDTGSYPSSRTFSFGVSAKF